jgi:hypothetical protein
MPPTTPKSKDGRHNRLDPTKLSKADRRKFEEARRNYLLAQYGTEEQKKHFAHLTAGAPPYDIFLDMAETAPAPLVQPPPQPEPMIGPLPKPVPSPEEVLETASESSKPALAADLTPENGEEALKETLLEDGVPVRAPKSEGLFGEDGPRVLVPGSTDDLDEDDLTDEQYDEMEAAQTGLKPPPITKTIIAPMGALIQPTAQPVGLTFGQATYIQSSPLDAPVAEPKVANQNELILWWVVFASLIIFALYRIANSRCWRRIGRRRSII